LAARGDDAEVYTERMESWSVGFEGDADVERHAGMDEAVATSRPAIRLRMLSDYICPWCYIGLARLERLRNEFDIAFDVNAFELRPGIPPEGISREEASKGRVYPPGYIDNLFATARDAGIDMKRPPLIPNTYKAHQTTQFAKEHGRLWEIERALFHAYFEEQRNIGDTDVLVDVAAGVGLDPAGLRRALDDGRYAGTVEQELAWARAVGITGVPTVIFNEQFAVVGAQDYAVFQDVARRVAAGRLASDDSYAAE
jgi:predicted DsbA family dithiol-disulfide isomerase